MKVMRAPTSNRGPSTMFPLLYPQGAARGYGCGWDKAVGRGRSESGRGEMGWWVVGRGMPGGWGVGGGVVGLVLERVVDEVELRILLRWLDSCSRSSLLPRGIRPCSGELFLIYTLWYLPLYFFWGLVGILFLLAKTPFLQDVPYASLSSKDL